MLKLNNSIAILTRTNGVARLLAIDTDAKTCIIYNGAEKVINWNTAASYRMDTGTEKTKTLTPKLLTALYEAEVLNQASTSESAETTSAAGQQIEQADTPDTEESVMQATADQNEAEGAEPIPTPDSAETSAQEPQEATEKASGKKSKDKKAKEPKESKINDLEKKMLATIPQLADFKDVDSVMDGKGFLAKVQELHGVAPNNSKALFVALKRKGFYQIFGKKSGQKKTTLKLAEPGIQYLRDNGLLAVV